MQAFAYKIKRSRRKTLSLSIERDGSVFVRAPLTANDRTIQDFVARHRAWAEQKLQNFHPVTLDLSDSAELFLFGTPYLIRTGRARIAGDTLYLPEEGREGALKRLLIRFVKEVMEVFTSRLARSYDFAYSSVAVSSARGRWGSCSREKVIRYSFRIAFLPTRLVEYIAVHELCHTVCFDHSPAFWAQVKSILPDYKERKKELKEKSGIMNVL